MHFSSKIRRARPIDGNAGCLAGTGFYGFSSMEKIKNGDTVIYKDQVGIVYGKPRQNRQKGIVYTIRVGDEYFKASSSELTPYERTTTAEV